MHSLKFWLLFVFQREAITIHIGQAGVQIGNSVWELYCLEHGILPDGSIAATRQMCPVDSDDNYHTIFEECESGRYVPRSAFIDLEPSVIGKLSFVGKKNVALLENPASLNFIESK